MPGVAAAARTAPMSAPLPTCAPVRLALPDLDATRALARAIAGVARLGDAIGLAGVLGAGKTTFARAFVNARAEVAGAGPVEVPSPTFTLVQPYDIGGTTVYHFDLYRVDLHSGGKTLVPRTSIGQHGRRQSTHGRRWNERFYL